MTTIPELLKHAKDLMHKAVENTRREFSSIRTGKATTSLLDRVRVEAYGSQMPLNQVAMVAAPEPRMLTVQPFDKGLTQVVEKAIRDSDLGLNPATQGGLIRVPIPTLTEERRRDLVKVMHKLGEEGRVAVRHARGDAHAKIKKLEKIAEDDKTRARSAARKPSFLERLMSWTRPDASLKSDTRWRNARRNSSATWRRSSSVPIRLRAPERPIPRFASSGPSCRGLKPTRRAVPAGRMADTTLAPALRSQRRTARPAHSRKRRSRPLCSRRIRMAASQPC